MVPSKKVELKKEVVQIVDGKVGYSEKNKIDYAMLEVKKENGFKELIYIPEPTDEQKDIVKKLNTEMGKKVTLITSIVAD